MYALKVGARIPGKFKTARTALAPRLGFWAAVFALSLQSVSAVQQNELPDSQQFLEATKPVLYMNFLLWPDLEGLLVGYEWKCLNVASELDEQLQQEKLLQEIVTEASWDDTVIRYSQTPQKVNGLMVLGGTGLLSWPSNEYVDYGDFKDLIWSNTEFALVGREDLVGRPTLVFTFRTSKDLEQVQATRRAAQTEGKLWFDEEDKVLVRVEGRYYEHSKITDNWSNLKGTHWSWQLRRTAEGEWVPDYHEFIRRYNKRIFSWRFSHWHREFYRWSDIRRHSDRLPETVPDGGISRAEAVSIAEKALAAAGWRLPADQPKDVVLNKAKRHWIVTFLHPDTPERRTGGPRAAFIATVSVDALTGEVQLPMETSVG